MGEHIGNGDQRYTEAEQGGLAHGGRVIDHDGFARRRAHFVAGRVAHRPVSNASGAAGAHDDAVKVGET
ncbi:hypothetical protein D3C71_1833450 [compost metagenome]